MGLSLLSVTVVSLYCFHMDLESWMVDGFILFWMLREKSNGG